MWPTKAHTYGSQKELEKYPSETKDRADLCTTCHSSTLCDLPSFLFFCFACTFVLLEAFVYICVKYFSKYSAEVDAALNSVKSESLSLISKPADSSGT